MLSPIIFLVNAGTHAHTAPNACVVDAWILQQCIHAMVTPTQHSLKLILCVCVLVAALVWFIALILLGFSCV